MRLSTFSETKWNILDLLFMADRFSYSPLVNQFYLFLDSLRLIYIYISANSCHFKLKRLNWMERVLFCLFIFDSLLEMNTHGVLDCMNE